MSIWLKEETAHRSDQDRTEKEGMEMENAEVAGENVCSPKRQKNPRTEWREKTPGTNTD
jgi:hypothetical protein